jgi:aminoglycoside phosphotransferase (APT) family kinase protein
VPEWDAEVAIDDALVRALVGEHFPELDASSARLLGEGWDNSVWVVEKTWAFRFPRRQIAIPCVRRELEVLPRLGPLLPVPIPEPRFVGEPSERFPWPFFGAPLLPGSEPADVELDDGDRIALAPALGRFLRVLHAPETLAVVDPERALPVDFNRRADMPFRVQLLRERFRELGVAEPSAAASLLAEAETLPPSTRRVLVHGDLHVRHVLVEHAVLTGVIDWGDACVGDPSIDLQLAWSFLPPEGRSAFRAEYGSVDADTDLRGRVLALYLCAMLALYARDVGYAALERECLAGLERTLVD